MERLSSVDMECVKAARFYHAPDISLLPPIFAPVSLTFSQSGLANPWFSFDELKVYVMPVTPLVTKVPVQARREVT